MNRRNALVSFLFTILLAAAFPGAGTAQIRGPIRLSQLSERPVCSEELSDPSSTTRTPRLSFISYLRSESECDIPQREPLRFHDDPPHEASPSIAARGLIESELYQLGSAGYTIAAARQHVLAILHENNSCSAWYAQAEPDPGEKFASLRFHTDPDGEASSVGEYDRFGVIYREPYVARAQQDVGAGSIITLNSNGAFFVSGAPIKLQLSVGGPLIPQTHRELHVGSYIGGSLFAQITALLHEYGHTVGLLPVDKGEEGSALLSTENTDVVLSHCRRQIEASANRAVVLPLALAPLQRRSKKR